MAKKGVNDKSKGGRPSSFKNEYVDLVYNYCLLGATDADLASFFGVVESTINSWKKKYPEFSESIKKGKEIADSTIARSLYDRAKGCILNTQQAFKVKSVSYVDGNRTEIESIQVIDLQQEQAPDTTAAIFWLKNRASKNWRDKQVTEHEGEVNIVWKEEKTYEVKSEADNNT